VWVIQERDRRSVDVRQALPVLGLEEQLKGGLLLLTAGNEGWPPLIEALPPVRRDADASARMVGGHLLFGSASALLGPG
jgi:hypothetical protein